MAQASAAEPITPCDAATPSACAQTDGSTAAGVAFHEAAHAVIARDCGFRVDEVYSSSEGGWVNFTFPSQEHRDLAATDCVIQTYLAGREAWDIENGTVAGKDLAEATAIAETAIADGLTVETVDGIMERNRRVAADKLLTRWSEVDSLAGTILLGGEDDPVHLDGETAVAAMR